MESWMLVGALVFVALLVWGWIGSGTNESRVAKKTRPDQAASALHAIEEIGVAKNSLGPAFRGCFNVLGLYVQLRQVPKGAFPGATSAVDKSLSACGGWAMQAGAQQVSYLDAYKLEGEQDWRIVEYRPGKWEKAIDPTLRLARFLPAHISRVGDPARAINVVMGIGRRYRETGQLALSFSERDEVELERIGRQANAERLRQFLSS